MRASRIATVVLALVAGGCEPASSPPVEASPAPPTSAYELRDVVDAALAAAPPRPDVPPLDDASREELAGLTTLVTSDPKMLTVAREDVARIGAGSWARLRELAADPSRPDAERSAAIDLIDPGEVLGAEELLELVRAAEPPWVRARAAWRLAEGSDVVVPELALRLRYEVDHETVAWIAWTLGRHGNYAGLDVLSRLANDASSPARASAAQRLEDLRTSAGVDSAADLVAAWGRPASERGLDVPERSEIYRYAVLRWIGRLDEFQLRGVDDARFVLSDLDAVATEELARALRDKSVYVRVHAAQSLHRMGPRGRGAGPALVAALEEPEVAPTAALALASVGDPVAADELSSRLTEATPLALRLACTRALGYVEELDATRARTILEPLLDATPPELAQAASESLLRRDPDANEAARRLAGILTDPAFDPGSTERALRDWLVARDPDALARWEELEPPTDRPETLDEARARREARASLVFELAE